MVAPPSPGYAFIQGKISDIPELTPQERDTLIIAVRSLNEYTPLYQHPEPVTPTRSWGKSPLDDYNERGDVLALLQSHGWTIVRRHGEKTILLRPGPTASRSSGDYYHGKGLFTVFTTSTQFQPLKGYRPCAVYAVLEHGGDFKAAARALLDAGYGTRQKALDPQLESAIRTAKARGQEGDQLLGTVMRSARCLPAEATTILADYHNNAGPGLRTFWSVNPKTGKPLLMLTRLQQFLAAGGYGLYFYGDCRTIFKLVHNDHGIVEEVGTEHIKKYVKEYVESLPAHFDDITRDDLLEAVYRCKDFTDGFFEYLPRLPLTFLKDSPTAAYYPFRNGIVAVTTNSTELLSYGRLGKCVWRSQIIPHHITLEDATLQPATIEFYRFMEAVCGGDGARIGYMMQAIGYLLHGYKDPAQSYCVVLAEETDDAGKGGGTGKGIFFKALGRLVPQLTMDGKNLKLDKSFLFQRVKLEHRLVVIDDVRAKIDFEGFYSMITEGFTIEKKNQDELYIPYADAPKLIFSTNYAIPATAHHARRRQRVLEFYRYYTPQHTPKDHFGHNLFTDWDAPEWSRFYNLLFACVQQYLSTGLLPRPTSPASRKKELRIQFGQEFEAWLEEYAATSTANPAQWQLFEDLYTGFLTTNGFDKKEYSIKRFKKALEDAATLHGYTLTERRNRHTAGAKKELYMDVHDGTRLSPESCTPETSAM